MESNAIKNSAPTKKVFKLIFVTAKHCQIKEYYFGDLKDGDFFITNDVKDLKKITYCVKDGTVVRAQMRNLYDKKFVNALGTLSISYWTKDGIGVGAKNLKEASLILDEPQMSLTVKKSIDFVNRIFV